MEDNQSPSGPSSQPFPSQAHALLPDPITLSSPYIVLQLASEVLRTDLACPWSVDRDADSGLPIKCGAEMNCYASYRNHVVNVHCVAPRRQVKTGKYKCGIRPEVCEPLPSVPALQEHVQKAHLDAVMLPCPVLDCDTLPLPTHLLPQNQLYAHVFSAHTALLDQPIPLTGAFRPTRRPSRPPLSTHTPPADLPPSSSIPFGALTTETPGVAPAVLTHRPRTPELAVRRRDGTPMTPMSPRQMKSATHAGLRLSREPSLPAFSLSQSGSTLGANLGMSMGPSGRSRELKRGQSTSMLSVLSGISAASATEDDEEYIFADLTPRPSPSSSTSASVSAPNMLVGTPTVKPAQDLARPAPHRLPLERDVPAPPASFSFKVLAMQVEEVEKIVERKGG